MRSLYRTLSVRYLSRRSGRAGLIVASIALGVAALVATRTLSDTMSRATLASANPMAGQLDFIVSNGELPIERAVATDLRKVPGIAHVRARLHDTAWLLDGAAKKAVLVMGVDVNSELKELNDEKRGLVNLSPGIEGAYAFAYLTRRLAGPPAVVGKELDNDLPKEGTYLQVEKDGTKHDLQRVGWIEARGDMAPLGGYVILLDLESAEKLLGYPSGTVTRIDVALEPGADVTQARAAVVAAVRGRGDVRTPLEQNQSLESASAGMRTGFAMGGLMTLIVAMFLVYNALSVSVAERRHEIGILLALGATRAQVALLFAGEATLLGLVGSLLGIPLGIGAAQLGLQPVQRVMSDIFTSVHSRQVDVTPSIVLMALVAGVLAAVGASLLPAVQAAGERPAEAVRRVPKIPTLHRLVLQIVGSALLICAGVALIALREYAPQRLGSYWGIGLVLLGALLGAPVVASLLARLLRPIARRWFAFEWRLAADNLVTSPGRSGLVIAALAAGVALVVETAGVIQSNREALRDWVRDTIAADIVVTAGSPIGSGGQSAAMSEQVGVELRKLPEVAQALPIRAPRILYGDAQVLLTATDAGLAYADGHGRPVSARQAELFRRLEDEPDSALVSENFPLLHGVGPGDTLTLPGRRGPVRLKVIGTLPDYSWSLGSIIMHRRDYLRHWGDTKVDYFDIYLREGVDPLAAKERIAARLGAQHDLFPLTRAELQGQIDGMIERFYGIAYAQQVVVMMVAALGMVMALMIAVMQRRREIGTLRAIGASQAQVMYAVLAEACLMGVFGTLLGFAVGIPLEWYALRVLILEEAGFLFPVHIPWTAGLVIATVALGAAALAGLGPALAAVRQRIPEAIAYE